MLTQLKKIAITALLFTGIVLASCESNKPSQKYPQLFPAKDIHAANEQVNTVQKGSVAAANKIDEQTLIIRRTLNHLEKEAPKNAQNLIESHANTIVGNTKEIEKQTQEVRRLSGLLEQAKAGLSIADTKVSEVEKQNEALTKERNEAVEARDIAVSKANEGPQKMLRWLIVVCVIMGGGGVAVWLRVSSKIGATMVLGAASVLVLAVAVQKYFDYIALGGLGILALAVGFLVWQLWLHRKAIEQTVETTEIAKRNLTPPARVKVFGGNTDLGAAFTIQDPSTEKMVAQIRKQLKPKLEPTINDPSLQDVEDYERDQQEQEVQVSHKIRSRRARR